MLLKIIAYLAALVVSCGAAELVGIFYAPLVMHGRGYHRVRSFMTEIAVNDRPTPAFRGMIDSEQLGNSDNIFWFLKIWYATDGISAADVAASSVRYVQGPTDIFADSATFSFDVGNRRPGLMVYCSGRGGVTVVSFPMNNCLFHPDFNHDGTVNEEDLRAATATRGGEGSMTTGRTR